MAKKKRYVDELKEKSVKELVLLRKELRAKLFTLKMDNVLRKLKDVSQIKKHKKKIAQIQTILSSKIQAYNGNNRS